MAFLVFWSFDHPTRILFSCQQNLTLPLESSQDSWDDSKGRVWISRETPTNLTFQQINPVPRYEFLAHVNVNIYRYIYISTFQQINPVKEFQDPKTFKTMVVSSFCPVGSLQNILLSHRGGFCGCAQRTARCLGKKGENGLRRIFPCIDKCFKESPLKVTKI